MVIKPLVTFQDGWMTEQFVFGGSKKSDFSHRIYEYQITSYLIDTGSKVILVDTSFPDYIKGLPTQKELGVNIGRRKYTFEEALKDSGYKRNDIDKIILTHGNLDHAGMISMFPNAEILISKKDYDGLLDVEGLNIRTVDLEINQYKSLKGAYKVMENIHFVKAYGHTKGHGIVIVYDEKDDLHYMFSGDATVTNDALYDNEILLVNENISEAKRTLNSIRAFIKSHKTVYLSTHDPISVKHLREKRVLVLGDER